MEKHLRYIVVLIVCLILCNQSIHLYNLYMGEKNQYIQQKNDIIDGVINEFNMQTHDFSYRSGYNAVTKQLIYIKNNNTIIHQLNEKDLLEKVHVRYRYDLRKSHEWTLKNFHSYLQTRLDSIQLQISHLQFVICDSTGQIKDAYPEHLTELPPHPEYCEPLGFTAKDTLYATYSLPYVSFIRATGWQIFQTLSISVLFVLCAVSLWRAIRKEKKSGEYRELFITNLVHDLKGPVAAQIKFCYLLKSLPEEWMPYIRQNREQLNRMLQSIDRMLLHSTDEHGLKLNVREFDLKDALEEVVYERPWDTLEDKRSDIRLDFLAGQPEIQGDRAFLVAVFQNFIDNALKYSGETVEVRVACTEPDPRHIQIDFKDNGYGIAAEDLPHVFDRFYRCAQQEGKKIKGHGQGLHYARLVISAHGGKIAINSEKGKGTTVSVLLPRIAEVKKKYRN